MTWFLLAMATMFTGSLSGVVLAGDDANAGHKPLPPDVVKAWTAAGATVGWIHPDQSRFPGFYYDNFVPPGAVPAFRFDDRRQLTTMAKLPDPGVPFGLTFVLFRTTVTDKGLKELAHLKSLQLLDLYGAQVTDVGLKELAGLKGLQSLRLDSPDVSGVGLKDLAGLKNLQYLHLGSMVNDAALKELAGLKGLQSLSLDSSRVTDAGMKEVARLKGLQSLSLTPTSEVTEALLKEQSGLYMLI
jgi:hypothetical protein